MYVIYKITNIVNNKFYIGSTGKYKKRQSTHLRLLRNNKHHSRYLQSAYNIDGLENFKFSIIEEVDVSEVFDKENYYISELKPEYNMMKDVYSHIGMKRSKEVCEKISKALTGKKLSEETKQKLRDFNLGKTYSEETNLKKLEALKRRWKKINTYKVAAYNKDGSLFKIFESIDDVVNQTGFRREAILAAFNKSKNHKTHKKLRWEKIIEQ